MVNAKSSDSNTRIIIKMMILFIIIIIIIITTSVEDAVVHAIIGLANYVAKSNDASK